MDPIESATALMEHGVSLAVVVGLLVISALVSGSEVAFFSLSPQAFQDLENDDHPGAKRVLKLMRTPNNTEGPRNLLGTILVVNNLVNISIVLIATVVAEQLFPSDALPAWVNTLIHVVGVTFLLVLFGEVIPKIYATSFGMQLAKFTSAPLLWAQRMLKPAWLPLVSLGSWMDDKLTSPNTEVSVEDLEQALELTDNADRTEDEQRILEGIVNFGSKDAKQVMTPRTDISTFSKRDSWEHVRATIVATGFSRIPVHEGSADQIVGVLHVKDLLPHLHQDDLDWTEVLRPPLYIPESKKIDDLLREFQEKKIHMAIVVDEYGGTSGLVTLEDVLEEIVGEIADEFDDEEVMHSVLDEFTYLMEAKTPLLDAYRILGLDEEVWEAAKGESDTLGGFMVEQSGRLMRKGESVEFEGTVLQVDAGDARRIYRVKIMLPRPEDSASQDSDLE
ncbi:MAG: gliding motility-associated protein GldE [Flavobacteriales bacterium]|nr:gliding motility-associated protein GldE [Flavobacteriales bacterium]